MKQLKFVAPGLDHNTQKPFRVYLPEQDRYISETGEAVEVCAYIERRISSGELVVIEQKNKKNTGGDK